ncbi:MAG: hypothetical protein ACRD28_03045 [Acidobacteriaceae bacterium]
MSPIVLSRSRETERATTAILLECAGTFSPRVEDRRPPDLYERERLVVTRSKFILAEGSLHNQDGVIHVKATHLRPRSDQTREVRSHDFH